jgi:hypothetical protein
MTPLLMNSYRVASQSLVQIQPSTVNLLYRKFVKTFPCCACGGLYNIEFAHTGHRGLGQKASDLDGIPLCRKCHTLYHEIGRIAFELVKQLSIRTIIATLQILAQEAGIDLNRDDTPKKRPGRATGLKWRRYTA